jgi:hypothetical protein
MHLNRTKFPEGYSTRRFRQRGAVEFAEPFFLMIFLGIGALLVVVFGAALLIGNGKRGKLKGLAVACLITSPILVPLTMTFAGGTRDDFLKSVTNSICKQELKETPGPFLVSNFVDTTGGLRSKDLQYFLTDATMDLVEIKLTANGMLTAPQDYPWMAQKSGGYARLSIGSDADGNCYFPDSSRPETFFTSRPPVRPGYCLKVSHLDQPTSAYEVSHERSKYFLSRWVLKERETGKIVAGFTDAHRVFYDTAPHMTLYKNDSCRPNGDSAYSTLMQLVRPTPEAIARASSRQLRKETLLVHGLPLTMDAARSMRAQITSKVLSSKDEPYEDSSASMFKSRSAAENYALGEKYGAWIDGTTLIRPQAGLFQILEQKGLYGKWATTGTQLIFVQANELGSEISIFGVDFSGKTMWNAQLAPLTPWGTGAPLRFEPYRSELTADQLLVHGVYGRGVGKENRRPWTIKIPLAQLEENRLEAKP